MVNRDGLETDQVAFGFVSCRADTTSLQRAYSEYIEISSVSVGDVIAFVIDGNRIVVGIVLVKRERSVKKKIETCCLLPPDDDQGTQGQQESEPAGGRNVPHFQDPRGH